MATNLAGNFVVAADGGYELEMNGGSAVDQNFALYVELAAGKKGIQVLTKSFSEGKYVWGWGDKEGEAIDKKFEIEGDTWVKVKCGSAPVKCYFATIG